MKHLAFPLYKHFIEEFSQSGTTKTNLDNKQARHGGGGARTNLIRIVSVNLLTNFI